MKQYLLGAAVIFLAGCATLPGTLPPVPALAYEGPAKPLAEVAVFGEATQTAILVEIDGKPAISYVKDKRRAKGYHVLPGLHNLRLITQPSARITAVGGGFFQVTMREYNQALTLQAQPGHTYIPRAKLDAQGKVELYLEDMGLNFSQDCLGAFMAGSTSSC